MTLTFRVLLQCCSPGFVVALRNFNAKKLRGTADQSKYILFIF